MAKSDYKCTKCDRHFDEPVDECPDCGQDGQIMPVRSIPKWAYIAGGVIVLIILILLVRGCDGGGTATVKRDPMTGKVTISTSGISASKLSNYRVVVTNNTTQVDQLQFNKQGEAIYQKAKMLEGECYTFEIKDKKTKQNVENITWNGSKTICVPVTPEAVTPSFDYTSTPDMSKKPYTWSVTVHVTNRDQLAQIIYIIGDKEQTDSVFKGLAPGEYEITVASAGESSTLPLLLNDIKEPRKPITRGEVQDVFNKVSNGSMTAGDALNKIASGAVRLATPTDDYSTLTELLLDMEMGAKSGDKIFYDVVDFTTVQSTGLIASGSLKVRKR